MTHSEKVLMIIQALNNRIENIMIGSPEQRKEAQIALAEEIIENLDKVDSDVSENIDHKISSSIFKTMERKLFYFIMMPAMILSWIFGLILIFVIGFEVILTLWLKLKLILITLLTIYHFYLGKLLKDFKIDQNTKSSKFFRIINEVPTILLILVVFIVIFKPI